MIGETFPVRAEKNLESLYPWADQPFAEHVPVEKVEAFIANFDEADQAAALIHLDGIFKMVHFDLVASHPGDNPAEMYRSAFSQAVEAAQVAVSTIPQPEST